MAKVLKTAKTDVPMYKEKAIKLNPQKDLTSLLEFVITLVIIEINGANFAHIFF